LPDAHQLQPGEVLICAATSPEWTPFFSVVGALVAGTGSLLAHAAVVAREFGIPAVVGAAGATALIRDGDHVTVDGSKGVVTVDRVIHAAAEG
jgi:pyruvate,water dikinase